MWGLLQYPVDTSWLGEAAEQAGNRCRACRKNTRAAKVFQTYGYRRMAVIASQNIYRNPKNVKHGFMKKYDLLSGNRRHRSGSKWAAGPQVRKIFE